MVTTDFKCPDCGGAMAAGYLPDRAGASATWKLSPLWVEGAAELSVLGNLKTRDRAQYPVTAYRCEMCGLLKFYALFTGDGDAQAKP